MTRKYNLKNTNRENVATMRLEMIAAGAYYWLRAEGPDENLVSAMNRMRYRQMAERFDALNIPKPTSEEMYAYATEKWPAHKLHGSPKSMTLLTIAQAAAIERAVNWGFCPACGCNLANTEGCCWCEIITELRTIAPTTKHPAYPGKEMP